ncbi:MAG: hypothetical protein ACPLPS_11145 [bacterium]
MKKVSFVLMSLISIGSLIWAIMATSAANRLELEAKGKLAVSQQQLQMMISQNSALKQEIQTFNYYSDQVIAYLAAYLWLSANVMEYSSQGMAAARRGDLVSAMYYLNELQESTKALNNSLGNFHGMVENYRASKQRLLRLLGF